MNKGKRKYDPLVKEKNPYPGASAGLSGAYNANVEDAKAAAMVADGEGMIELLQKYGIPVDAENRWFKLALELAREHEPGFQMEAGPRGRKTKWTREKLRQLYDDVQDKMKSSGKGKESEACMHLKQKYGMKHATLISQYKKAKHRFAP